MRGKPMTYYQEVILDDCYVDFFAATNTTMLDYPLRLGNPKNSSPTVADRSTTYILDSAIGDESIQNPDVVARAVEIEPDIVVPADTFGDPAATTGDVVEIFSLLDETGVNPRVIIPLQSDAETTHVAHYNALADRLSEIGVDIANHLLAVGGVKEWEFAKQLAAIIDVRSHVGREAHIHGLGFGFSQQWAFAIRCCPWLLDSIDNSSSHKNIINGKIMDSEFNRMQFKRPRGTNSTVLSAMLREFVLYMFAYVIGPHGNQADKPREFPESLDCREEAYEILKQYLAANAEEFRSVVAEREETIPPELQEIETHAAPAAAVGGAK